MKKSDFDSMLMGIGAVSRVEVARAVAPLIARIEALEHQNRALNETIQALAAPESLAVEQIVARYKALS